MSVQIVLDVTNEYMTGSESGTQYLVKLDIGGYDYAIIQSVNAGSDIYFYSTNDSGDIQGVSDGSAVSSLNPISVLGVNLATNVNVPALNGDMIARVQSVGRYLWLDGTPDNTGVDKLLVRLYKIH